ncbi:MAG: DUF3795 domain-containing protein [Bacteroidales bacterium]
MIENFNVAFCGLCCSECGSFKKGKCAGCHANEKASWCEIRKCCQENSYLTCADCRIIPLKECKKYHNFFAKLIGWVSRTDRSKCIDRIKEIGSEAFAKEMHELKQMSIKK